MREGFKIVLLWGLFLSPNSSATHEVSVSCMMVYDEGGAPAVLASPECPQWGLSPQFRNRTQNCQFATIQGRRDYQEDRITCNLEIKIPVLGKDGPKEVLVGVAAVFDGHGGKEASEMASENLLDYFFLHVVFNSYKHALSCKEDYDLSFRGHIEDEAAYCRSNLSDDSFNVTSDESIREILRKALLRTIHDIDTKFSEEALRKRYFSGSTATVVLLVDGQVLVANVGDTKALLCSEKIKFEGTSVTVLHAEELTRDHHPDRDDERARIEAAGGFVSQWGLPRVNGLLAVSRSIADVYLKRYGVSPVPEVIGWRNLTAHDRYLVVASDGIFESLTPQYVCDILWDADNQADEMSKSSCLCSFSSLADRIVNEAFEKGSGDNLSVVAVPLKLTGLTHEDKNL